MNSLFTNEPPSKSLNIFGGKNFIWKKKSPTWLWSGQNHLSLLQGIALKKPILVLEAMGHMKIALQWMPDRKERTLKTNGGSIAKKTQSDDATKELLRSHGGLTLMSAARLFKKYLKTAFRQLMGDNLMTQFKEQLSKNWRKIFSW